MIEKLFKLKENNTTIKTELTAGLTTFMTMAYILAVNPSILAAAGMDAGAVLLATAFASFFGCVAMALLANYPFALAPGMGLNAYFAFTVCGRMGYPWQIALFAVFIEGIIFIVLSLTNVREAIFNAIPISLKHGASVGVGLFIAFIGLQGSKIIVNEDSTLVTYVKFSQNFQTEGICALLAIIGVLLIAILYIKGIKGSILFGIIGTWLLGMLCQAVGLYQVNEAAGFYSLYPTKLFSFDLRPFKETFMQAFQVDFTGISLWNYAVVVFSFLFVDLFDTLGALIGLASKADMLDENGRLPRIKGALLSDALATSVGAVFGTSTTTTYIESTAGIATGGRTGLTSLTTGILFLFAVVLSPLFVAVPSFATAPALIFVGFLMISSIKKIDFNDWAEAIPAYLCLIAMPLAYSVAEGLAIGVISYVFIHLLVGKAKKITPLMYILAILFISKYIFL